MSIHIKTALDSIRRSPFQALAAIFVLTLTFFVATNLSILVYSSAKLLKYFETRPQVIAFLKDDVQSEEISDLQNRLAANPSVKEVKYVSKEEALEIYKKATADKPLLSELVSPSIFPASLEFSLTDLASAQTIINEVKSEAIVDQVGFTASLGGEESLGDVVSRLRTLTFYLRAGGAAFVAVLSLTSFLVLIVIIGMRMTMRRGEIEILSLIGATASFIRSPIVIEALIYSATGVLLGWFLSFLAWLYLAPNIIAYFRELPVLPEGILNMAYLFGGILLTELGIGALLALIGSMIAVRRAKRAR